MMLEISMTEKNIIHIFGAPGTEDGWLSQYGRSWVFQNALYCGKFRDISTPGSEKTTRDPYSYRRSAFYLFALLT